MGEEPAAPGQDDARARRLLLLAAAGFLARLLLMAASKGSNDADAWERFGRAIAQGGLRAAYEIPYFNHPPLAAAWTTLTWWLSDLTGVRHAPLFKLLPLAADALVGWLLWQVALPRGRAAAAGLVALFAWNPVAILVGAYHCNTDGVVAALCLLSAFLLEARRAPLAAGVTLAAAIHIKLIPVLLVVPLLACCRDRREAQRYLLGLLVVSLALVPWTLLQPLFVQRVLGYTPQREPWGVMTFVLTALDNPGLQRPALLLARALPVLGKWFTLMAMLLLAVRARRAGLGALETGALGLALFLVLATGFGVQYTVVVVPLLTAVRPDVATRYSLLAGAFLALIYGGYLTGAWPLESDFPKGFLHMPGPLFGLLAWVVLLAWLWRALLTPRSAGPAPTAR